MSSDAVISVENLSKRYLLQARPMDHLKWRLLRREVPDSNAFWALKNVSFELERGETLGIMGRNGCGKSTLLEVIAGTLGPTSGSVDVRGELAALLELGSGFSLELTGRENVYVYGSLLGMSTTEIDSRFDEIVDFAELGPFIDEPVKNYSSGMFVRLAFAIAVNATPKILVIDEALAVGDEAFQRRCYARIEALKRSGVSLLFVSHSAGTVMELCDRVMLMDRGEALILGPPAEVLKHYHRLIYAPLDQQDSIREQIRVATPGDAEDTVARAESVDRFSSSVHAVEEEGFDSGMVSKSLMEYVPQGARISEFSIRDPDGGQVNLLERGGLYFIEYRVDFERDAFQVRFGMLAKTTVGTELGGLVSAPPGRGIDHVPAGTAFRVRLPFRPRLAPEVYFSNVGVVALSKGGEIFLHRIIDALVFRVIQERDSIVTSYVDLTSGEEATIEDCSLPAPTTP